MFEEKSGDTKDGIFWTSYQVKGKTILLVNKEHDDALDELEKQLSDFNKDSILPFFKESKIALK